MKTTITGTLLEWLKFKPEAYLFNEKFLQKGAALHTLQKTKKQKVSYPISWRPDYEDTENLHTTPMIHFGPQAPYIVKGRFEYMAGIVFWPSGSGGAWPVSNEMLNDPNWTEDTYLEQK